MRPTSFIPQYGTNGNSNGPLFDVPMYCLEAPSRPLQQRPTTNHRASSHPGGGGGAGLSPFTQCQQDVGAVGSADGEENAYWFALGVPLRSDDISGGQYLYWAAMTLVVQPCYKFQAASGAVEMAASARPPAGAEGGPRRRSEGHVMITVRDGGDGATDSYGDGGSGSKDDGGGDGGQDAGASATAC
ncbi:hypothetical protein GPECTOR_11g207 [Gonium pectorale]|uniref:Uncharacterized protein n=1 Tax=Gonium pectorale TaxID=33097 RepID=A0A150GPK4_GONPE|nr:hypothetical protein GPECTOR_11g207 [Gonium pectorale]|eukprot:KXZ51763.1 hypothetical protein GPECTOR_11g207 [Gonium pectorale]